MFVIVKTIVSKFGSTRASHTNSEVYFLHFTFVEVIVYIVVIQHDIVLVCMLDVMLDIFHCFV